jgi:hypothetical protein
MERREGVERRKLRLQTTVLYSVNITYRVNGWIVWLWRSTYSRQEARYLETLDS